MTEPLYYEDLDVGAVFESAPRQLSQADVEAFAALTGDHNPVHLDARFARSNGYEGVIIHGLLGLSLGIGLIEELGLFDGTAIAFLGLESWTFAEPVYPSDLVHARLEVLEKRRSRSDPSRGIIRRNVSLHTADGRVPQYGVSAFMLRARDIRDATTAESGATAPSTT